MRVFRFVRRLVAAGLLAGLLGMAVGNVIDIVSTKVHAKQRFVENEIHCLTNIIYREARGEHAGVKRWVGIVVIARRDDPSSQWPDTICGNAFQKNAFSGIMKPLDMSPLDAKHWDDVREIATEVYHAAWKQQLLPRGWECVRFFKVSDAALSRMGPKQLKQLGIKKGKGVRFFDKLELVDTRGTVSFYSHPASCTPLPTT